MKNTFAILLALACLLLGSGVSSAEDAVDRLHLADGSILQGRVLSMDESTLQFVTSFGGDMSIPRNMVRTILLNGAELPMQAASPAAGENPTSTTPAETGSGILEVALKGDSPRSSTRYRNARDRDRAITMNTLYFKVYVDGELLYKESDDSIEKDFTDSGWTKLRNEHTFSPAEIELPAGVHKVLVVVGNELDLIETGEKQSGMISAELMVDEILVRDGEKTRLAVEGDGARFSYGKYKLKLLSRH